MTTPKHSGVRAHTVVDPRTLGRPVHLLGGFANQLRDDMTDYLHARINRRYKASFQIEAVSFASAAADSQRWLSYAAQDGRIHFSIDRPLLLCLLRYRYGSASPEVALKNQPMSESTSDSEPAPPLPPIDEYEPETATEERLATMLGQHLAELAVRRIESLQRPSPVAPAPITFAEAGVNGSGDGDWLLKIALAETRCNISGTLLMKISSPWMTRLLQGLAPGRERSRQKQMAATKPFPARLQLTLRARLLEKEVSLGTLLDLRQGDVLPISLGDADVLVGDSRLFTASIAEHHGKLCLTSLADVD